MINQQILAEQLGEISEGPAINLPVVENLSRNIRKESTTTSYKRSSNNRSPYRVPNNNKQKSVLFFDSGAGAADRIIAFASLQARQLLVQSENWYKECTYKVYPEVFYQLYTFHAQYNGRIFTCFFALLPNKTEAAYKRLMIAM